MLEPILASVRSSLPRVVAGEEALRAAAGEAPPSLDFAAALAGPGLAVIAEIKRRSPSAGPLAPEMDPVAQAGEYVAGRAGAISVLTEPDHFAGSLADLMAVRAAVSAPLLRKDFILHPAQVWEARAAGADAVLLIVAALSDAELGGLMGTAAEAAMTALVEVHTPTEAERAVAAGAEVIGVNNRDLETFTTDLGTAERIAPLLAGVRVTVAESGVSDPDGAARMAAAGYDAILVGEALVRSPDPAGLIARLRAVAP